MSPDELVALIAIPAAVADSLARLFWLISIGSLVAFGGALMWTREDRL